jgi:hypothetical protein
MTEIHLASKTDSQIFSFSRDEKFRRSQAS